MDRSGAVCQVRSKIVNSVWRGKCDGQCLVNMEKFDCSHVAGVASMRLQRKQPQQLIIKFNDGSTMLLFKTGKFRIMGGKIDEVSAHCNVLSVTTYLHPTNMPEIALQTMTMVYTYPYSINITKLSTLIKCHYNTECFPAVQITKYKPIHVNVFASGKVIMCGIKNIVDAKNIETELDNLIACSFLYYKEEN